MSWLSKKTRPIRHAVKYTPAFILSFIVPRSPRKWVFGSNMGFAGNAKYLFLYLASTPSEKITPLWIASSGKEYRLLKSMNINVARRWSLKGTWTALRSKYFVYNSYAPDVHLYAMGRAIKVNLWHGVGIKNIEYAISVGPMHDIFHSKNLSVRNKNRWFFIKPDIFLSTSPLMTAHFSRCFRIPAENCIESSYPRNAIFGYTREQILQIINE
ncbi:MAG: CDP-glycerol glycerophosphotransferase family protein, partial [Muribaculaceae bacterium]|nr:CDP-glycerol glycerophosphotransferase family protein [Muribaculaceae bacterium]